MLWDTTRVCPNCGSTNVGVDRSNVISLMALQSSYECRDCGYAGIFPEVENESVTDQQEEIRERGRLQDKLPDEPPSNGRVGLGILFLVVGVPPTIYASSLEGKLVGILSLVIGGGVLFEYLASVLKRRA